MPAYINQRNPFSPAVNPITKEETEAVAKALNDARVTCCVKGCDRKRIGWEAVATDGFMQLRGIGFCEVHFKQLDFT